VAKDVRAAGALVHRHEARWVRFRRRILKRTLTQCAWAASPTRGSYFQARYRRLSGRRGRKRAAIAVVHAQLVTAYHVLRDGTAYQDLGASHLDDRDDARRAKHLVSDLERLGYRVTSDRAA
jgi:hypothetical protein